MEQKEILSIVDHTLLSQTATWKEIQEIIDDGGKYGTASVCIPPCFVQEAAKYAAGAVKICTVIGFPNGYATTASKVYEAWDVARHGADEIDMVINLGWAKSGQFPRVLTEINRVKEACGKKLLKVIIETCLLTDEEIIALCGVVSQSGADFIKTSTGFSTAGANAHVVELMQAHCTKPVKAAGGISSLEDAEQFIALGAKRLGTSRIVKLVKSGEENGQENAY